MKVFGVLLMFCCSSSLATAHELNPAVIESLTGETIEHSHESAGTEAVADPRDQSRTFYSFPEWYIVYSAQEYADFVAAGNQPSQFPYFAAIGQMWDSWEYAQQAAGVPPDATTNTVLWTIAISFTIEYGLAGVYENTIGWLSELLHFNYKSTEDVYIDAQAMQYGQFLNQTPWYDFSYMGAFGGLWKTYGWSSLSPRGIERRIIYSVSYAAKAIYAAAIRAMSEASFEGGAGLTTDLDTSTGITSLPRYRAFKDPAVELAQQGVDFVTIQGHDQIALSVVVTGAIECDEVFAHQAFSMPFVTDESKTRHMLSVPVSELAQTLRTATTCGLAVEHIYDY